MRDSWAERKMWVKLEEGGWLLGGGGDKKAEDGGWDKIKGCVEFCPHMHLSGMVTLEGFSTSRTA